MEIKKSIEAKKNRVQKCPKVAIIVLNWNGWKGIIEYLESIARNAYSNYQVIIMDNNSTDDSIEKMKD